MEYSPKQLLALPTLCVGQTSNLKVDTGETRVWVSRCGVEDGEPEENHITVETLVNGRWI